jgi:hypothetical protein
MRRVLGFAVGIGLGLGLALTISKMLRRAQTQLPSAVANEAGKALASMGDRVRTALETGVTAMRDTEAELRDKVLGNGR